jgi:hypothetical protein
MIKAIHMINKMTNRKFQSSEKSRYVIKLKYYESLCDGQRESDFMVDKGHNCFLHQSRSNSFSSTSRSTRCSRHNDDHHHGTTHCVEDENDSFVMTNSRRWSHLLDSDRFPRFCEELLPISTGPISSVPICQTFFPIHRGTTAYYGDDADSSALCLSTTTRDWRHRPSSCVKWLEIFL